jgi:allantoinase
MATMTAQYAILPQRTRYKYSVVTQRLAFWIGTNVEVFAFQTGIGHDPTKLGEPQTQRNYAWRDCGNRVGIWRLIDLYDEFRLQSSCLISSYLYEYYPKIYDRIRQRGDEFVGHGRTNADEFVSQ